MEKLKVLFQNTLYIAYPLLTGVEGSERVLNKWQQFYQDVERSTEDIQLNLFVTDFRKTSEMGF